MVPAEALHQQCTQPLQPSTPHKSLSEEMETSPTSSSGGSPANDDAQEPTLAHMALSDCQEQGEVTSRCRRVKRALPFTDNKSDGVSMGGSGPVSTVFEWKRPPPVPVPVPGTLLLMIDVMGMTVAFLPADVVTGDAKLTRLLRDAPLSRSSATGLLRYITDLERRRLIATDRTKPQLAALVKYEGCMAHVSDIVLVNRVSDV
jgi:hypothetical protein